jgi:prophage antirepressor-like protein
MTRRQLKAARAVLGLGVHDVATILNMSGATIVKVERLGGLKTARASTVQTLVAFYQGQGVTFVNEAGAYGVKWSV